jgi:ribosomal protein S18 acetylase RimI-like enzyme
MKIHPVSSRNDIKAFINFPYHLYRDDPIWVPPLRSEQKSQLNKKRNPLLEHCEWQLFLLEEKGKLIGRIAAFIDTLAIDFWKERIGLFGYFECIPNPQAADMLLESARDWLLGRNCTSMRGPWSFVSQEWGLVVEGFKPSPVIMAPYNPPYYEKYFTDFGLVKVKDLLCWYVSAAEGYKIPERIMNLTDAVKKRYKVNIRQLDMKNYDKEVKIIIDLANNSIIDNWGYSPVTEAEVKAMARDMKAVIQPRGVLFAEDEKGNPIGFAITLPDINNLLKGLNGRLFPFGFLKVLTGIPHLHKYRMFALGVSPEYQGKAIDSLLYRALNEALYAPDIWMEINYVLEDNWPMVNAVKKLGATPLRRYRIYEKSLI